MKSNRDNGNDDGDGPRLWGWPKSMRSCDKPPTKPRRRLQVRRVSAADKILMTFAVVAIVLMVAYGIVGALLR